MGEPLPDDWDSGTRWGWKIRGMSVRIDLLTPRAREAGLVVRELAEETIVYDLARNEAHCLGPVAAAVWKYCDGQTTVGEIVDVLRTSVDPMAGEDTVWRALTELGADQLLEEQVSRPAHSFSRRDLMVKGAVTVGMGLPLITSLLVPTAAHASSTCGALNQTCCAGQSCTGQLTCCGNICGSTIPNGGTCLPPYGANSTCCSGLCSSGTCAACLANGSPCSLSTQCCSGTICLSTQHCGACLPNGTTVNGTTGYTSSDCCTGSAPNNICGPCSMGGDGDKNTFCTTNADCCSNTCIIPAGKNIGKCTQKSP